MAPAELQYAGQSDAWLSENLPSEFAGRTCLDKHRAHHVFCVRPCTSKGEAAQTAIEGVQCLIVLLFGRQHDKPLIVHISKGEEMRKERRLSRIIGGISRCAGAPDACFDFNRDGNAKGFCSFSGGKYHACSYADRKCGKLYCSGGAPTFYIQHATAYLPGRCKVVVPNYGNSESLSMVTPGTKCDDGKACQGRRCQSVESLYQTDSCAKKCKGNAVCDHELACHCVIGFIPPNCIERYVTSALHSKSSSSLVVDNTTWKSLRFFCLLLVTGIILRSSSH
ncbi:disintegrin and metalloproteinase domain-containing protein 7-like [Ambystoma mexicanum]|uniref:disintegrin and metalloproteinase domain-containing protein 7-like n=1 Tax=Ambystoma mexicanum TaxID=8296 RepID=UPI0037E922E7